MKNEYFIRKVLYTGMDSADSFALDDPYPEFPDAYGVYIKNYNKYPGIYVWEWIDDFRTIEEAQKFILERQG
jgi:hypothetical protein